MKNKSRYIFFALLLIFAAAAGNCSPPETQPLTDQKYNLILTEFSRLRLEYELYSEKTPPTSQYLIDSLAARHQVNRNELISQIARKNPELYRFLTESE